LEVQDICAKTSPGTPCTYIQTNTVIDFISAKHCVIKLCFYFFSDSEKTTVKGLELSSDPDLSKIKVPEAKKVRVMKVTKQSNGQLLCKICSGIFEDANGVVKHMPYCKQELVK
jgi:hypothetical protein